MLTEAEKVYRTVISYSPGSEREASDRQLMLTYMDSGHDALTRDDTAAHFTASAWVTDPERENVLMAYHNIYRSWAWLGGHADGDGDLLRVALRETEEETGISGLRVLDSGPVSLEVLNVSAHVKNGRIVSPHLHLNLTYLLEADKESRLRVKDDENSAVGWRSLSLVLSETDEEQIIPIYAKLIEKMKKY